MLKKSQTVFGNVDLLLVLLQLVELKQKASKLQMATSKNVKLICEGFVLFLKVMCNVANGAKTNLFCLFVICKPQNYFKNILDYARKPNDSYF